MVGRSVLGMRYKLRPFTHYLFFLTGILPTEVEVEVEVEGRREPRLVSLSYVYSCLLNYQAHLSGTGIFPTLSLSLSTSRVRPKRDQMPKKVLRVPNSWSGSRIINY